jgi:hypothetical protein
LNDTPADDWVAEKSFTGTDTSPKVTVSDAIARAAIFCSFSARPGLQA